MKRIWFIIALLALLSLAACAGPAATPAPAATTAPAEEPTAAPEPQTFVSWYQYDQGNEDPKSDERVGNEWLRKAMPQFNKDFEGKWVWENSFHVWDKMTSDIIAAVQAKGDVPDLIQDGTSKIIDYHRNGTMQDLSGWAKAQSWWADMDPSAIAACTDPDGKLLCIPMVMRPQLVYVWKDRFPNGFPKTPEQYLAEGERLKGEGLYAMTYFGSTDFDGEGLTRAVYTTLASFGGKLDDGQGNMLLNTPENVAAVAWLREMVQNGYVPEIAYAGGFQEEEAFKDASAGAFPTGLFGYRYVNPLTAPSGKKYEKKNEQDMLDAIAAGDVYLSPFVAPAGKTPSCDIAADALWIPVGAKHIEGAYEHINWLMTSAQNPDYVLGPGAGFPTLISERSTARYQTPFYQQAGEVVKASACRPWLGSLTNQGLAKKVVTGAVYKLVKQDPSLDIAAELTKAQEEYNSQK
jgi:multiple sugar transport system substrate-binding protein